MSTCTRCGARIIWVKTAKNGKRLPLDAEPTPVGHVVLTPPGRLAIVLNDHDRDRAVASGERVWRAHFASCSRRWRGP